MPNAASQPRGQPPTRLRISMAAPRWASFERSCDQYSRKLRADHGGSTPGVLERAVQVLIRARARACLSNGHTQAEVPVHGPEEGMPTNSSFASSVKTFIYREAAVGCLSLKRNCHWQTKGRTHHGTHLSAQDYRHNYWTSTTTSISPSPSSSLDSLRITASQSRTQPFRFVERK